MKTTKTKRTHTPKIVRDAPVAETSARRLSERWQAAIVSLLLVVLVLAVFSPLRHAGFVNYDDTGYVVDNPHVRSGLSLSNVAWAFTTNTMCNWHPLMWLSLMLDVQLFGMNPAAHHGVNVALHALNAVLLFLALRQMTNRLGPSAFVAALFAAHPAHVESVAWISERKDVLSASFWMLAMTAYAGYAARGGWLRYTAVLLAFGLGLLAKPMLVTLPAVLLLLDVWPLRRIEAFNARSVLPRIVEKLPLAALAAASSVVTFLAQDSGGGVAPLDRISLGYRIGNAITAYARYLGMAVWPSGLAVYYPHPGATLPVWQPIFAAGLIVVLTAALCWYGRRQAYLGVGWLWFLGTLVPVIGLVQVGTQALADRYTYLPYIGLFIAFTWGAADLAVRLRVPRAALAAASALGIGALGWATSMQSSYWTDSATLFRHALNVTTENALAHYALGDALLQQKQRESAIEHFRLAVQANPNYVDAFNALGGALGEQGNAVEAAACFNRALQLDPHSVEALSNSGKLRAAMGKTGEAVTYYERALRESPDNAAILTNLGGALADLGRTDEAIQAYEHALRADPFNALAHNNLGNALKKQGALDAAMTHYRKALALEPENALAHNNLGNALRSLGKLDEAIEHYRHAIRIDPRNAMAYNNLGAALTGKRQFREAIDAYKQALALDPANALARENLRQILAVTGGALPQGH